jgi:hypothetical protein
MFPEFQDILATIDEHLLVLGVEKMRRATD